MKKLLYTLMMVLMTAAPSMAQEYVRELKTKINEENVGDDVRQRLEKLGYKMDTTLVKGHSYIMDRHVVTNPFSHNIFFTGSVGMHTFRGDFANYGKFSQTLDMDWFVGVGKWFTPSWGIKIEGGNSRSHGFMDSQYNTPYTYGDLMTNADGKTYYRNKIDWYDISVSGMFNISRAIYGYEGPNSQKLKNQFIASVGIGYLGHYNVPSEYFVANEFSGHVELQYSRFLDKKKHLSIDAKLRGLLCQTNFDRHDHHKNSNWIDANWGFAVGLTYHIKHNVWGYKANTEYVTNYMTQTKTDTIRSHTSKAPESGQFTFYVFYPNNYSGRNDAPIIASAKVNAIDYLAGGVYTQKKYKDNGKVALQLAGGKSPVGLEYIDIATEKANQPTALDEVPRGYEICSKSLSLSQNKDDMAQFREKYGFYYAPIWDGRHVWQYRIDDATKGQSLSDASNYSETASFGLNSKEGTKYVQEYLVGQSNMDLYSFADVYSAVEGAGGYISQYADEGKVAELSRIFNEATITHISVTGVATNQDNNADENVRLTRNTALAQNRANTVVKWLKNSSNTKLAEAHSQVFMVNSLSGPVHKVDDTSTRGLQAKINRCVKVTIHYMMMK